MIVSIAPAQKVRGSVRVPGDKSIGHRALLFGALAEGTTRVRGLSDGEDVRSTRRCLAALGIGFSEAEPGELAVEGTGGAFAAPRNELDCGNSGTTMRLLAGLLASRRVEATLDGDASLRSRPMSRIAEPLRAMGARIELAEGGVAPMRVRAESRLHGIDYVLPLPSAQLKSALMLAALGAEGTTTLSGALRSRDHTERMLPLFGGRLEERGATLVIEGGQRLRAPDEPIEVGGDLSSAAFWIAAALIVPDGSVEIAGVNLNPTRMGFIDVLRRMGAQIEVRLQEHRGEPAGTIVARSSRLLATDVDPGEVPALIDELPLLAIVAAFAEGTTRVRGAEELRVKESDRIEAVIRNGTAMGMRIEGFRDGFSVTGPAGVRGADIDALGDHRIAMAFSIAALGATGSTTIHGAGAAAVSYPSFFTILEELRDG